MTRTTYCLTGDFDTGSIEQMTRILTEFNYRVLPEMSRKIDYLLIGRKTKACTPEIEQAVLLLQQGHQLTVTHENHWLELLERDLGAWQSLHRAKATNGELAPRKARKEKSANLLWEGAHLVRFRYRNAKGEETDREVKLHRVTGENGQPEKLSGFCLYRNMNRTFIAANIVSAEVIDAESGEVGELKELLARL